MLKKLRYPTENPYDKIWNIRCVIQRQNIAVEMVRLAIEVKRLISQNPENQNRFDTALLNSHVIFSGRFFLKELLLAVSVDSDACVNNPPIRVVVDEGFINIGVGETFICDDMRDYENLIDFLDNFLIINV